MRKPIPNSRRPSKKFADRVRKLSRPEPDNKPLKVLAFDEARFGLISWHRRRYSVRWAFAHPTHRQPLLQVDLPLRGGRANNGRKLLSLSSGDGQWVPAVFPQRDLRSLPRSSSARCARWCSESSLRRDSLSRERRVAASSGLASPELDPVERWFQEFRRELSNKAFKTLELLQTALGQALQPYWEEPARLQQLTGFSWWVEAVNAL